MAERGRGALTPRSQLSGERRYTEEELALILNRAAERQEGGAPNVPRYTLAEIQDIAAGAGIAPDHVASVATSLPVAGSPRGGVLGAPMRFRFEESIDGEISDETVAELFDLARRETGLQGTVSEALGLHEWKAQDAAGWTFVSVARRRGRTTIAVLTTRDDAAGVAVTIGGMSAFLGSIGVNGVLLMAGLMAPVALPVGFAAGIGGAWLATRAGWHRVARRAASRSETLGAALVATARRALEGAR